MLFIKRFYKYADSKLKTIILSSVRLIVISIIQSMLA
jgi:hypothetical protein